MATTPSATARDIPTGDAAEIETSATPSWSSHIEFKVPAALAQTVFTLDDENNPRVKERSWSDAVPRLFQHAKEQTPDALGDFEGPTITSGRHNVDTTWTPSKKLNSARDARTGLPKLNVYQEVRCGVKTCPNRKVLLGFQWDELARARPGVEPEVDNIVCHLIGLAPCVHLEGFGPSQRSRTARRVARHDAGVSSPSNLSTGARGSTQQHDHLLSLFSSPDGHRTGNDALGNRHPDTTRQQRLRADAEIWGRGQNLALAFLAASNEINERVGMWNQRAHGGLQVKGKVFSLEDGGFMVVSRESLERRREYLSLNPSAVEGIDATKNLVLRDDGVSFDSVFCTVAGGAAGAGDAPILIHTEFHLTGGTSGSLFRAMHKREEIERYAFGDVVRPPWVCTDAGKVETAAVAKLFWGVDFGEAVGTMQRCILEDRLDELPATRPVEDSWHAIRKRVKWVEDSLIDAPIADGERRCNTPRRILSWAVISTFLNLRDAGFVEDETRSRMSHPELLERGLSFAAGMLSVMETPFLNIKRASGTRRVPDPERREMGRANLAEPSILDHPTRYAGSTLAVDDPENTVIGNRVDAREIHAKLEEMEHGSAPTQSRRRTWENERVRALNVFEGCGEVGLEIRSHDGSPAVGTSPAVDGGFRFILVGCQRTISWSVPLAMARDTVEGKEVSVPNPFYCPHAAWYVREHVVPRVIVFGKHYLPDRPLSIGVSVQEGGFAKRKYVQGTKKMPAVSYLLKVCGNVRAPEEQDKIGLHDIHLRALRTQLPSVDRVPAPDASSFDYDLYERSNPLVGAPMDRRNVAVREATTRALRMFRTGEFTAPPASGGDAVVKPATDETEPDAVTWERGKARFMHEERELADAIRTVRPPAPFPATLHGDTAGGSLTAATWRLNLDAHFAQIGVLYSFITKSEATGEDANADRAAEWADVRHDLPNRFFADLYDGNAYFDRVRGKRASDSWSVATAVSLIGAFAVWARLRTGHLAHEFPFFLNAQGQIVRSPTETTGA